MIPLGRSLTLWWRLAQRELAHLFYGPIAPLSLGLFALAAAAMLFVFDLPETGRDFFSSRLANLSGLFGPSSPYRYGGLPLLLILLVPAITMPLFAEERRAGTLELLRTWPLRTRDLVFGKFLAAALVCAAMLLLTLPLVALVHALGPLDWGMVFGGYLGLYLTALSIAALGLLASALTRASISAYLLGLLLAATFYFIDGALGLFSESLRPALAHLSIKSHLIGMTRGVLDLRDLAFFLALIFTPLALTALALRTEARS